MKHNIDGEANKPLQIGLEEFEAYHQEVTDVLVEVVGEICKRFHIPTDDG